MKVRPELLGSLRGWRGIWPWRLASSFQLPWGRFRKSWKLWLGSKCSSPARSHGCKNQNGRRGLVEEGLGNVQCSYCHHMTQIVWNFSARGNGATSTPFWGFLYTVDRTDIRQRLLISHPSWLSVHLFIFAHPPAPWQLFYSIYQCLFHSYSTFHILETAVEVMGGSHWLPPSVLRPGVSAVIMRLPALPPKHTAPDRVSGCPGRLVIVVTYLFVSPCDIDTIPLMDSKINENTRVWISGDINKARLINIRLFLSKYNFKWPFCEWHGSTSIYVWRMLSLINSIDY